MTRYVPRPYISHRESGGEAAAMQKGETPPTGYGPHAASEWLAGYHDQKRSDAGVERSEFDEFEDMADYEDAEGRMHRHSLACSEASAASAAIRERVARTLPPLDVVLATMPEGLRETAQWPSRCYEVAQALLGTGLLAAAEVQSGPLMLCYGMYHGHVARDSPFAGRGRGMSRHGWLESADGIVIDPTRWVFTSEPPALHVDTIGDYDLGGTRTRMPHRARRPGFDEDGATTIDADPATMAATARLLGDAAMTERGTIGRAQAFWLSGLHLEALGAEAPAIYLMLEDSGHAGTVPTDHRQWCAAQINEGRWTK